MKFLNRISSFLLATSILNTQAQELRSSNGIYFTTDGPVQLVMNGMSLNNGGNFRMLNGTLVFTGDAKEGAAHIAGNSLLQIHHLKIDRNSGDLQLNSSIIVLGNLELVNGNLDLNNYTVDLGTTGLLVGESRAARVIGKDGGYISSTVLLNAPDNINPGNLGLLLSGEANMGSTTIIRSHLQQQNKNGEFSIQRYYEIKPSFPVTSDMKVQASFFDVEATANNPLELVLWSSTDAGRNWKSVNMNSKHYELAKETGINNFRLTYFRRQSGANQLNNAFIQLYPNPVRDRFTLSYYSSDEEDVMVNLYTKSGQLLEAKKIRAVPGINKIEWSVAKYAAGTYQLRVLSRHGKNLAFVKE